MPRDPIDDLRKYATYLVQTVDPARARAVASRVASGAPIRRWRRRWVLAVATAGVVSIANVGLAAVVDPAAPGDFLYPLDRAYERLSGLFGSGDHAAERLAEADVVIARGDWAAALALTAEALDTLPQDPGLTGAAALITATAQQTGVDRTNDLHDETMQLLVLAKQVVAAAQSGEGSVSTWAKAIREQARQVALVARGLGGPPQDTPGQGSADDVPGGPPESVPAGPPDGIPGGPPEEKPGGQPDDSPSNTAPGQTAPGQTAPGQTAPGETAPGRDPANRGSSQGRGNGNN